MRLIDADALADEIAVLLERNETLIDNWFADRIEDAIAEAPTIDAVEVRHGRWILGGEVGWPKWTCSVCGGDGRGDYKLCPWCGARMDGGQDED